MHTWSDTILICVAQGSPPEAVGRGGVVAQNQAAGGKDGKEKSGRRIRWHEGDKFLDEFDDSHLWARGECHFNWAINPRINPFTLEV